MTRGSILGGALALAVSVAVAVSAAGCKAAFGQTDGFPDKLQQGCATLKECKRLQLEAQQRIVRCKDNEVGSIKCSDAHADQLAVDALVREKQEEAKVEAKGDAAERGPLRKPKDEVLSPTPRASLSTDSRGALVAASPQPTAYALIAGVERYRDAPPAVGARYDAQRIAEVARQTLGISPAHVRIALDDRATKGDIEKELDWLKANVPAGGRVYFFFSGHGAPNPTSGSAFLLPYDGDTRFIERTGLSLESVLKTLGETRAKDVLAVVDTCFSGAGGRSLLPPGARALVRVKDVAIAPRVALLSASTGAEISGPVPGGEGGLFSQTLAEGLGAGRADSDGDGQISLQELLDWVKPRVARDAKKDNRAQTPTLAMPGGTAAASSFIVAWGLPPP